MLRPHQTVLHTRAQQRAASSLTRVAAFTAARVSRHRQVAVAVAPPDGACAAVDVCVQMPEAVPAELEQQRSFLESLPTLPAPGTPEFEFSKDSFLQRYEMSEVLGEVRFTVFSVQLSAQPCTELLIVAARKCTSAGQPPNAGPKGLWRRAMRMWAILSFSCCICPTNAPALWLCCAIAPCSVSTPCRFTHCIGLNP
jgi:hypothetical protein